MKFIIIFNNTELFWGTLNYQADRFCPDLMFYISGPYVLHSCFGQTIYYEEAKLLLEESLYNGISQIE